MRRSVLLIALVFLVGASVYPQSPDEMRALYQQVHSEDPGIRFHVVSILYSYALGGKLDGEAVPALAGLAEDRDFQVRSGAVATLSVIGPRYPELVVPVLIKVLQDEAGPPLDGRLGLGTQSPRPLAASALGHIGDSAAVPALTKVLKRSGSDLEGLPEAIAKALIEIAKLRVDAHDASAIQVLRRAQTALAINQFPEESTDMQRYIGYLELQRQSLLSQILTWSGQSFWRVGVVLLLPIYLFWFLLLRFVVLPRAPLWVLAWNETLAGLNGKADDKNRSSDVLNGEVSLPWMKLSLQSLIKTVTLIGLYHYHPRVLDAWVQQHIGVALSRFQSVPTVEQRRTFVALPVMVNRKRVFALSPDQLQAPTARDRWCIFIKGEGGLGKTSLACQLASWAMAEAPTDRLCRDRRMLPVLLEPDIKFDLRSDIATFEREVRGKLQQLIGAKDPIPDGLFRHILRDRRVLVILDGLSEMQQTANAPGSVRPENPEFPANALIVTSRTTEKLGEELLIEPQRIDSSHLLGFINGYLEDAGQTGLSDSELFDASRKLADLVTAETGITPLLARLFAERLVDLQKRNRPISQLPRSVPELMLAYLNTLNRDRKETHPEDPVLHQAAIIAAWECLRSSLRPGQPGSKEAIREALKQERFDGTILEYLERLRILTTIRQDTRTF